MLKQWHQWHKTYEKCRNNVNKNIYIFWPCWCQAAWFVYLYNCWSPGIHPLELHNKENKLTKTDQMSCSSVDLSFCLDGRVRIWCQQHESMCTTCLVATSQDSVCGVMVWGMLSWQIFVPVNTNQPSLECHRLFECCCGPCASLQNFNLLSSNGVHLQHENASLAWPVFFSSLLSRIQMNTFGML